MTTRPAIGASGAGCTPKAMPAPPIVVLSGSGGAAVELPETGRELHALSGYKGVDLRIGGEPLICRVVRELNESGCFARVYVAGPKSVHEGVTFDATLIDVDGAIGANIQHALEVVMDDYPNQSVAFITCDILPSADLLREVMARYASVSPCDLFFPLVKVPVEDTALGASNWKPTYAMLDEDGTTPVTFLPGHLVIGDPGALRLRFGYRLLNLAYRTRNRPLNRRGGVLIRGLLFELLIQDLRHLLTFRAPTVTFHVITTGIHVMTGLMERTLTRARLERRARKIVVTSIHRRRYPQRRVDLPLVDGVALAMDIDTEEEARFFGFDGPVVDISIGGHNADVVTSTGANHDADAQARARDERNLP
ncbi:MAG: hypothetical protein ACI8PT_003718 [Gammaproteobacteria bacterium]|jgi:hypothetical protein